MKRILKVFAAILYLTFATQNANALPLNNQLLKSSDSKANSFKLIREEANKRFLKDFEEYKKKNNGQSFLKSEKYKGAIKKVHEFNKAVSEPAENYHMAGGYDNDGWLSPGGFNDCAYTSFNLTHSLPLTYPFNLNQFAVPILGGTTISSGFGLVTTVIPFFLLKVGDSEFPFMAPEQDYLPLDAAFDHTNNMLYILYLNSMMFSLDGHALDGSKKADSNGKFKKPQNGNPEGFYVVGYSVDLFQGGFNILEQQTPYIQLYPGNGSDLAQWEYLYMGLACDKSGQLFTVDYKNKNLCKINNQTGAVTIVGELDIPFRDPANDIENYIIIEFVNLEFDNKDGKLYLLDAAGGAGGGGNNELLSAREQNTGYAPQGDPPPIYRSRLYEVNTLTADVTLLTHDSGHNYLWSDDGGINESHFVTGFHIPVGGILFYNPWPDAVITVGAAQPIVWWGINTGYSKLEYSTDNGNTWVTIASNLSPSEFNEFGINVFQYNWNVPHGLPTEILLRATDEQNPYIYDRLRVFIFDIQLLSPIGGEYWHINSDHYITWRMNGEALNKAVSKKGNNPNPDFLVNLYYSVDNGETWTLIAADVPANNGYNQYLWTTPTVLSSSCRVMVASSAIFGNVNDAVKSEIQEYWYDISNETFTLYANNNNGDLLVVTPNGGENLNGGTRYYITWRRVGGIVSGALGLEYSTDGGKKWNKINSTPIAGVVRYSWSVPEINSTHCLVRIVNHLSRREYDRSDNEFSITSSVRAANYPNPFNSATKIVFGLEKSEFVSLKVYNSIGQQVAELVNKQLNAGKNEFEFNGAKLPSGVYYYNLRIGDKSEIHKMLLLK